MLYQHIARESDALAAHRGIEHQSRIAEERSLARFLAYHAGCLEPRAPRLARYSQQISLQQRARVIGIFERVAILRTAHREDAAPENLHALEILRAGGIESARELSMGMSDDFEIAVEEGATLVRLGTILFGARTYNG